MRGNPLLSDVVLVVVFIFFTTTLTTFDNIFFRAPRGTPCCPLLFCVVYVVVFFSFVPSPARNPFVLIRVIRGKISSFRAMRGTLLSFVVLCCSSCRFLLSFRAPRGTICCRFILPFRPSENSFIFPLALFV